jgi:YHS domain-containing protein
MLVRWLYWLVIAVVLRMVWRSLFGGALAAPRGGAASADSMPTIHKGLMVRDPVCGLHVPEGRALVEIRGGERHHFCSETCRASFRSSAR